MGPEEVNQKVFSIIALAAGLDEDEVKPESRLKTDLDIESIDMLDIQFQLEKSFGIKIAKEEFQHTELMSNTQYVVDGKLTEAGLAELARTMPMIHMDELKTDPQATRIFDLLAAQDIANFVQRKLGQ